MEHHIEKQILINSGQVTVWTFLTTPEMMSAWMGNEERMWRS